MGFKKVATLKEAEEKGVQLAQKIAEKMGKMCIRDRFGAQQTQL